jgi:hypothetical protein
LLGLPAELREQIYELVLGGNGILVEHIQVTKPSLTGFAIGQTWRHAKEVVDCNLCCVAAQISGSIINQAKSRSQSGTNVEMT